MTSKLRLCLLISALSFSVFQLSPGQVANITVDANGNVLNTKPTNFINGTVNLAAGFQINSAAPAGKIPIGDGTNFVPGDPLVQGLFGDGSTSIASPVIIGGYDTAGTPALHRAIELNANPAGTEYGLVTRNIPSGTQPVSGTFWQATQPVSGTFWQATQPVSGTITANQGGNWSMRLQGNAGAILDFIGQNAAAPSNSILIGGEFNTTPTTITSGNASPLQLDSSGNLLIKLNASGVTQTVSGTVTANQGGSNWTENVVQLNGTTIDTNSGTKSAGTQRIVLATDQPALTNALKVDGSAVTQPVSGTFWQATQPVSGTITSNQGGNWSMRLQGNAGAILDFIGQNAAAPANSVLIGGEFNTTPTTITSGNASPLQLDSSGNLLIKLNASGVTQTVSGTVTANQGGSNWTENVVQLNGTTIDTNSGTKSAGTQRIVLATDQPALTNALKVDGSAVTQPVSGTFWQATQPVSGTVTSNIGTTNGLALDASVNGLLLSQGSTTSGQKGELAQGAVTTSAPAYTTAQTSPLSLNTSGGLRVDGSGVTQPVSGTFWQATQPVSGTVTSNQGGSNWTENVVQLNGTTVDTNSGTKSAGTQRIVLATDQPALTNALKVDGSAVTQPVSGTVTANAGTGNFNFIGTKTNNNAAPGATNVGVLPAIANAAAQSWTEGDQVGLSTDLSGNLRVTGSLSVGGTTDNSAFTAGTSTGTPAMGFYHSTIDAVTDGRSAALAIDSKRNLFEVIRDAAGNARGANVTAGNALTVDGSAVTQPVSGTFWQATQPVSGTVTSQIKGNAGATLDSAIAGATAPANDVAVGGIYNNATPITPTDGQAAAIQLDQAGNQRVFYGVAQKTLSAQGTAQNSTQTIFTNSGAQSVLVQLTQTTTLTAGAITFEVSYDGSNWSTIPASNVVDPTSTSYAQISLPYTVQASTNKQFLLLMNGAQALRIKTSTAITGTGSVTPNYTLLNFNPAYVVTSPTATNFNVTATQGGSNWTENVVQLNGTTVDTNSGTKSAGTQRVVLATDQPALTNKLLVTPDSIALPAHQSTNVDQWNGTTVDTNSGTKSAGTVRVVLATDQPALTNKLLVTPDSVALPAHQSTNVDQVNGTTVDTNSGNKSAGTQRVVLATDQPNLTTALNVTPQATESYLGFVGGKATIVSANFTRPANTTAYSIGQLVANSTTAGSVVPLSFTVSRINDASGMVRRARIKKSTTSTTNATFRLHLYQNDPSAASGIANGDGGTWSTKEAGWLGDIDVDMTSATNGRAFTDAADGVAAPNAGTEINFIPKSGTQTIYALIEARGAYTPGNAEVFTVYLETLQN